MSPAGRAPLQVLFPGWYALGLAGLPHWAVSFPLAALAALSPRLADESLAMRAFGLAVLALALLVIAALVLATVQGLRDGSLLAPEAAATPPAALATIPAHT